ncbi:hypothetical protein ES707_21781 [subsurface metagenome]
MPDALLSTDEGQYLPVRIKGHAKSSFIPLGNSASELGEAL